MREKIRDRGRLEDALQAALTIEKNRKRFSESEFKEDPAVLFGFTKMLEIIGEAIYMLSKEYRENNPSLPWNDISGMRHVLVHGYRTISADVVWNTVNIDVPQMIPLLRQSLQNYKE